ncbi:MAG: hypothetical protein IPM13_11765 [Phycisphaerales bacterium]|nr:hypothetical protein [Phycisphaerales bacterium]
MNRIARFAGRVAMIFALGLSVLPAGCTAEDLEDILDELEDVLDEIDFEIRNQVNFIQAGIPVAALPAALPPQSIILDPGVTIITDISQQLVVAELPDITLLGFENLTDVDAYYTYLADGQLQGILVFSGETLLLEYPCLTTLELVSGTYFDPWTGIQIDDTFDIVDGLFINPIDFICGEAIILSDDGFSFFISFETNLVR